MNNIAKEPMKMKKQSLLIALAVVTALCVPCVYVLATGNGKNADASARIENYSAIGTVSDISTSSNTMSISDATDSDGNINTTFIFNLDAVDNMESADYTSLSFSDINIGDKIVAQGIEKSGAVTIQRIIDVSWNGILAATSTDTTTTESVATTTSATSTDEIASSTTSTSTSISTSTEDVDSSTEATTTVSIIDTSLTNTIASSTESTSTSTDDLSSTTDSVASSTDPVSSSTDSTNATSTTIDPDASTTSDIVTSTDTVASTTSDGTSSINNSSDPTDSTSASVDTDSDASTSGQ